MVAGDPWFEAVLFVRPAVSAGMGQLQAYEEIIGGAEFLGVSISEGGKQPAEALDVPGGGEDLGRMGPTIVTDGGGLSTPDELAPLLIVTVEAVPPF